MSQSFKKLFYQLLIDSIHALQLGGYTVLIVLALVLQNSIWILFALLWAIFITIVSRAASYGRPAWLAMSLTPNFYAVRAFGGRWSIFQRKNSQVPPGDAKAHLKGLVEEQTLLPAALPPGRYQAITHDTVLRRLKAMEWADVSDARPVYTSNMRALQKQFKKRKRRGRLPFDNSKAKVHRQFYVVKFTIKADHMREAVPC